MLNYVRAAHSVDNFDGHLILYCGRVEGYRIIHDLNGKLIFCNKYNVFIIYVYIQKTYVIYINYIMSDVPYGISFILINTY